MSYNSLELNFTCYPFFSILIISGLSDLDSKKFLNFLAPLWYMKLELQVKRFTFQRLCVTVNNSAAIVYFEVVLLNENDMI